MLGTIVDNIPSLLLYLAVFVASAALVFYGLKTFRKGKKVLGVILLIVGLLIPPVMAGIRSGVGNDYYPYLSMYRNATAGRKLYFRFIEPASAFLIRSSGALHCSFLMFFGFSLIINICFFFACRNVFHKDDKRATLAYLMTLLLHFSTSLNVMRSIVTVAILALAFSLILEKRNAKRVIAALALIPVAALFHLTALLAFAFVPAFWIIFGCKSKKKPLIITITLAIYIIATAAIPAILFVIKTFIPLGDYGRYLGKIGYEFSVPIVNVLMAAPVVAAGIYLYYRDRKAKQNDDMMINLFYCTLFYLPISIAVGWITYAAGLSRISFIFDPLIIFLMVYLVTPRDKISTQKKTILASIVLITIGSIFVRNMFWSGALPYKTIFAPSEKRVIEFINNDNSIPLNDSKMVIFVLDEEKANASED